MFVFHKLISCFIGAIFLFFSLLLFFRVEIHEWHYYESDKVIVQFYDLEYHASFNTELFNSSAFDNSTLVARAD